LTQSNTTGTWTTLTQAQAVSAYAVGSQITTVQTSPAGNYQTLVTSARIVFFITPSGFTCSSITGTVTPVSGGVSLSLSANAGTFPSATFEYTTWVLTGTSNYVITPDFSNVDNFQAPAMFEIYNGPTVVAQAGNSVYSPHLAITTAITGPNNTGGMASPFVTWLGYVGGAQTQTTFESLALPATMTAPAMIQSPTDYLAQTCNGNCSLNTYFDAQLTSFFKNAFGTSWGPLSVMGDPTNTYPQEAWSATSNTSNCPVYLNPDGKSLTMKNGSTFVICNPVGSVVPFGQPTLYANPTPQIPTIQLQITAQQYSNFASYNNWFFGQPSTGYGGIATIYNNNLSYCNSNPCITFPVSCGTSCPLPNMSVSWSFTNISNQYGLNIWESASQMVFANDGAFITWAGSYLSGDLLTVAESVQRNIVEAFSRGMANCNNVTMSKNYPNRPAFCSNVSQGSVVPAARGASDAYWTNESNWYPTNGIQDYYSQYLHTARLNGNNLASVQPCAYTTAQGSGQNLCANIFLPPNLYFSNSPNSCSGPQNNWADGNQGVPMGMTYAFSEDENPDYTAVVPANVPSKADPIPTCWGSGLGMNVVIGRTEPLAAHDLNGDTKSDIVWRDTSGDLGFWLMNGAVVSSTGGVGGVSTAWSIVGQRDFNGDGMVDLLWRDGSGDNAIWFMSGTQVASSTGIAGVPTNWAVVGTGDFNGDGLGDILWEDNNGNVAVWLMNGPNIMSSGGIGAVPPGVWTVAGIGDFNGDGRADILWRDTSGDNAIWFMNGTAVASMAGAGTVPTTWSVIGTGDFNGDGIADIVWRDSSGNVGIWLMNGASVLAFGGLGNVATSWSMVQTGDYNGDGMSDLLWRDTSGNTSMWFMIGTTVASTGTVGNIPVTWTVQSANAD
jgi:FG-GAP-like repeat